MLIKIPYITLWARKFDECVSFYKNTLGLPVELEKENFVQFTTSGTKLYIHRTDDSQPLRSHTVEIHFEVDDVDKTYQNLKEKGVTFKSAPQNMPWGNRLAAFRDPEGYVIELVGPLKEGEFIAQHP